MWTEITRRKHARKGLRYSSDLTDPEWVVLEPLLPARFRLGRPAKWSLRTITDALLYILPGGQPWRMLPGDFPPMTTVHGYSYAWRDSGAWNTINHLLLTAFREAVGREASPSKGRRGRRWGRAEDRRGSEAISSAQPEAIGRLRQRPAEKKGRAGAAAPIRGAQPGARDATLALVDAQVFRPTVGAAVRSASRRRSGIR